VAALIGTQMRTDDTGMPVRLALAGAKPVQMAAADVPPAPAPVEQLTEIPGPAEQENAVMTAPEIPFRAEVRTTPVATAVTMMRKAALILPTGPSATSNWVVQLGAYDSSAVAKDSWRRIARANGRIARFPVSYSTANVEGRLYHRLAVGGFGDRVSAYQMCRAIRSQGGACFIRAAAPVRQWAAAAKPKQFASR